MNALERHIKNINLLYEKIRNSNSENQKTIYHKQVKELEDDLLEYCNWRKLDYQKVYAKVVK